MASTLWRERQGTLYLSIDHGGSEEETISNLRIASLMIKESRKTNHLVLCDGSKAFGTSKVAEELIQFLRSANPYVARWAFWGFNGLRKVVLKNVLLAADLPFDAFATEAEAIEHLFRDEGPN